MKTDPMTVLPLFLLNLRGNVRVTLNTHGQPLCECNQETMRGLKPYIEKKRRVQRFQCDCCGKSRKLVVEASNIIRLQLDRTSQSYKDIYQQRTATERISSQSTALGIERPNNGDKLRLNAGIV